jgi:CO/xanthine dehydrogenase Mo-binding subunit
MSVVGTSVPRKEVSSKLTGRAKYLDDLSLPGMLHGVTIRSPIARGRFLGARFPEGLPWDEFTVVTARDIPGQNVVKLILEDQPILVDSEINHAEEPLLLLAHPSKAMVEEGRRRILLDLEESPPVLDMLASLRGEQIIWGDDNILKRIDIVKGDVDPIWSQAAHVVEGEYWTGASEQLYIENNGMLAHQGEDGSMTVWGSMQCPYYVLPAVCYALDRTPEKVQIIQCETGGGFGGKEEYPSILACHAALLALKSGKPVKMVYDREEDMAATTKRHPSYSRHKTAVDANGKLLAMEVEFILDGGAYATLSSVVLSRGAIHAAGPYFCPNVQIRARAVATNHPPHGAYRGFGNPQSLFALERHLNKVAARVGLKPEELRRRNFLADGLTTATGQIVRDGVDLNGLMERAFRETDYLKKVEQFQRENASSIIKRGMGFAVFFHGSGFTGIGETKMASIAGCEATPEGKVRVLAASTEIGQGTKTIFSQIVADALGLPYEMIEVAQPDTRQVPNSGPTVASRTCMVVGKLVETASLGVKQALVQQAGLPTPYTPEQFADAIKRYLQRYPDLRVYSQYHTPPTIKWDEEKYVGDAYAAYGWAVYVAEVSYDPRTFEARVDRFLALQDVGKVLHPILAEGQVEGGVAQGIGWALSEEIVYRNGRMINNQMTNYIMPTSVDLPEIKVLFHEAPYSGGPQGAKGVGELPIDGPAPAILNALSQALDVELDRVPATPEVIMRAVERVPCTSN